MESGQFLQPWSPHEAGGGGSSNGSSSSISSSILACIPHYCLPLILLQ